MIWFIFFLFLYEQRRPSFFLRKLSQNGRQFSQEKHDGFLLQMECMRGLGECLGKVGMHGVIVE